MQHYSSNLPFVIEFFTLLRLALSAKQDPNFGFLWSKREMMS
jgi:hypothetical protein